ncbi:MAG TPA: carboxylating nicotinate-nucleotide diphosphorylase [Bryobacteraceae bacterium]|nr:carboxylating nicotinate-nucleotide diphosphorylase [Bryobacteraceae bacterium]
MFDITHPDVRRAVEIALEEDIRTGDVTTDSIIPADLQAEGHFVARQDLTLAGAELLPLLFDHVALKHASGDQLKPGDGIATVRGPARLLLTRERVALNFMQRLSGVATLAAKYVAAVEGTGAKILDTRKTTPGLRVLEKMAAAAGGIVKYRMGLWDAVLIKNNHIRLAGGVRIACERAMEKAKTLGIAVQVEVRTRAEIEEALACGATLLLLDNMTPAQAAEEIRFVHKYAAPGKRAKVEISGGVTLSTVRAYAEAGPDFISSGAITHSATAVDINCGIYAL